MAKISQKELSLLRADYLLKREAMLANEVSNIAVVLFDKVFDKYLVNLKTEGGRLVYNNQNISMIKGLDKIYAQFNKEKNIPTINKWSNDLYGIIPLNEKYFTNIQKEGVRAAKPTVVKSVNQALGVTSTGKYEAGGFSDIFIKDKMILDKIRKQTIKSISSGQDFVTFKNQLKETIVGVPKKQLSGAVQQYYRNYAYDAYQKVDRLSQDTFAKELGLRYFFWQGGLIATSRNLCEKCNGRIIDSHDFKKLKFSDLKMSLRDGLDETWNPMEDLGQFGCRHSKDYISNSLALVMKNKILPVNSLKG